jgi:two-component system, NtrC family, sensor kinase
MRLARKLTLAIVAGLALMLAANAYYRSRRELAAFDADMQQDHETVGRALAHAVSSVGRASGRAAALQVLASLPEDSRLQVRWLDAGAEAQDQPGRELFTTQVPVWVDGVPQGAIEIAESRHFQQAYVRRTVIRSVILTGIAVLSTSAFAVAVGVWFVGRPMQKLVEKARQIGAGNLQAPLLIRQRDEIGELADEMNAMCVRLADARAELSAETLARIRSQEQLRHADRLATVGKLASGVAHELGSPLSVALVRANMIAANPGLPQSTRDAGRVVGEQIDRITAIVRQLLEFARGSGSPAVAAFRRREPSDLRVLAEDSVEMLQPLASKRQLSIHITCEGEPPRPPVNPQQLQQVLVNLLVNAMHASHVLGKVGVVIASRVARPPADLAHALGPDEAEPRYAVLTVTDEGVGIRPDILPRIFEPFFTTKAVGEGTGLGLSVAYGMVRDHGGWIEVESEPGQGSRFSVYLPMATAEPLV